MTGFQKSVSYLLADLLTHLLTELQTYGQSDSYRGFALKNLLLKQNIFSYEELHVLHMLALKHMP